MVADRKVEVAAIMQTKKSHRKPIALVLLLAVSLTNACADEWEMLLDKDLSKWEVWMGIPHTSITGLPEGTYTSDHLWIAMGQAMGLNNDPKKVFSVKQHKGEPMLQVTGEILGALTTLKEYENYHLTFKTRFGDQTWPPRVAMPLDTGLLYHCQGENGNSKPLAWKACLEFQIIEGGIGDLIALGGMFGTVKGSALTNDKGETTARYDPASEVDIQHLPFAQASSNQENPKGQWNRLDLYVLGTNAVYVVNGVVVNVVENTIDKFKNPLTRGQLQIQSEGGEVYYSDMRIRDLKAFPKAVQDQLDGRKVPLN